MGAQREQKLYESPLKLGTVPADVAQECAGARERGRPYTELRPIREGVDNPEGRKCEGCQGHFHEDCDRPVVAVQYSSSQGEAFFYCEEHGIAQDEWDEIFASKAREQEELPQEWHDEVAAIMRKLTKKKRRKQEEAEALEDPT